MRGKNIRFGTADKHDEGYKMLRGIAWTRNGVETQRHAKQGIEEVEEVVRAGGRKRRRRMHSPGLR